MKTRFLGIWIKASVPVLISILGIQNRAADSRSLT